MTAKKTVKKTAKKTAKRPKWRRTLPPTAHPVVDERTPIVLAICARVATGDTLVKDACVAAGISRDTLHRWTRDDPALSDAYARAREDQAHAMAEQCIAIADGLDDAAEERLAVMAKHAAGEDEDFDQDRVLQALTHSAVQRDKLRLDARKWLTSKIAPRVYGDRLSLEHDVSDQLADRMRAAEARVANAE